MGRSADELGPPGRVSNLMPIASWVQVQSLRVQFFVDCAFYPSKGSQVMFQLLDSSFRGKEANFNAGPSGFVRLPFVPTARGREKRRR